MIARLLGHAASTLLLCGCVDATAPDPSSSWPPGTAVAACGLPISREEVEHTADALAEVNPAWTRRAMLREALVTHLVPRAAARAAFADESTAARARCETALAALLSGAPDASPPELVTAPTVGLEFHVWSRARELPLGEWHGPFEGLGRWFAVRVITRERGDTRALDSYELELVRETFLPPSARLDEILADCELAIVDPSFEELVPLSVRTSMRSTGG